MIEQALLIGLEEVVKSLVLSPAPKLIGVVEPIDATELPALVVSIEQSQRLGNGLGERAVLVTQGALPWQAQINLANPVLPADPTFSLLSPDRLRLTLPHGGLVRVNGSSGSLGAADIQVLLNGAPRTLVSGPPAAGEFSADALSGTLTFGDALPTTGNVQANYFLGQWEQRLVRSSGLLRLAVLAADAAAVQGLSDTILDRVGDAPTAVLPGLSQFGVAEIGSIGAADAPLVNARRRIVRFRFEFEQEINVPDASGGIIQRIPVQAFVD